MLRAWVSWAALTALFYLMPLDQEVTDLVSNVSFVLGAGAMSLGALVGGLRVDGLDRKAWIAVGVTLIGATAIFAVEPAGSDESITSAMVAAPLVAAAVLFAILTFGRHAVGSLGVARLLLDGLWLTGGLAVLSWASITGPLVRATSSAAQLAVFACFPFIAVAGGAITSLLWPYSEGSARRNLAALGSGAAVTGVAGAIHLRLGLEGALRFGTAYDYLWTIGIGLLGVSTLEPAMGLRLRSRTPSPGLQQVITVLPVLCMIFALAVPDERPPMPLAMAMLTLLTVRVVVATAENERLAQKLRQAARHDDLTGLLNRRAIFEKIADADLDEGELTVLYIDLDRFKAINDTHGHAAGDAVLVEIGRRLRSMLRSGDWAARLGGDEFLVVSHRSDDRLAARLHGVLGRPIRHADLELHVSCCIGVSRGPARSTALIDKADRALYQAKGAGRDRVVALID